MFCPEVLSDFNCFQESCIITNLFSIDLVVEGFPLVLCASALEFLVHESQPKIWVSLSISLLARKMGRIALPQHASLADTVLFTQL